VEVVTVDVDASLQAATRAAGWPPFVEFVLGDGADVVKRAGRFDLVFADAPGGKLTGLEDSIGALASRGVLVVDDMDLTLHDDANLRGALAGVRRVLVEHPELVTVELAHGSGVVLGVRRPRPAACP
jgi:demethylmenaquinone methyltransferase/2-methoxy-6-polyprenyl-1,4-benzoquinol methylase